METTINTIKFDYDPKILEDRMHKAWQEIGNANAAKKYLAKLKGTRYLPYIITTDYD